MLLEVSEQARLAAQQMLDGAGLKRGDLLVVGCSTSEVMGRAIGQGTSSDAARAIFEGMYPVLEAAGVHLVAQCCEHLNRALVIERAVAVSRGYEIVNAVPLPGAGGAFATLAYARLPDAVLVDSIRAQAGMDIGSTLIGMHLQAVAVPMRLEVEAIGQARLVCARTRPRYIGGPRAAYLQM